MEKFEKNDQKNREWLKNICKTLYKRVYNFFLLQELYNSVE